MTKQNAFPHNRVASVATLRWCSGSSRNAVRLPCGKRVQLYRNPHGVVGDVHTTRLERDPTLIIYVPYWQNPFQVSHFVVRSSAGNGTLPAGIRSALQTIDPTLPAPKIQSMADLVAESVAQRRFQMRVATAFAVSAMLLAALGIYGVVAYGVSLRRREFGIRMALGAKTAEVYRLVVWRGLKPVTLGIAAGILAALGAAHVARSLLFGVAATDGLTLGLAATALGCVAAAACLMPALSAARLDPSRILRDE